ncbi:hypothetical protein L0Y49_02090 [bacterium]|nr:hypothetical protein [bacterium]MCI0565757.1 hypothetical protein [bacterium]
MALPLKGGIEMVAETLWNALNPENRVAIAVKFIDLEDDESTVKIINKYRRQKRA